MTNLDLPETAPTWKYNLENHDGDKIAVYSLFSINGDEVTSLEKALTQEEYTDEIYSLQDLNRFDKKTLRDIFDYHLENAETKKLMPTLFVVIHHENYESDGVLLVNLLTDEDGSVGKVCQSVSEVLLSAVGLQIGNVDFDELEDFDPSGDTPERVMPSVTYGIYCTNDDIDMYAVREILEPESHAKYCRWEPFWTCRVVAGYTEGTDPIRDNAMMHPFYCSGGSNLLKYWLICIDNLDPTREGVLLVHIEWDGNTNRSNDELIEIGSAAEIETERCDIDKALKVLLGKENQSTVKPGSTQFAAYGMKGGAALLPTLSLLEPDCAKKELADCLCLGVATYDQTDNSLQEVLKWHPFHCLQQPQIHRQWFIGVDNDDPSKNGVLLVHIKWNGNIQREGKELLEAGAAAEFKTERCDVSKALEILAGKANGQAAE